MELSFGTVITISYAKGSTFGSYFNLGFAYVLFIAMCSLPFFSQIFYQLQFKRMSDLEDKEFDNKYGAPYEGLKQDKRWSLFHPFMLCVRRISFMYLILNHYKNPLLQLSMIQLVNMISLIYLIKVRPFNVSFINTMEILNECANIVAVYLMITFTDVIDSLDT